MSNIDRSQIIALSAICLAAKQVHQIATGKEINQASFSLLLRGLMCMKPDNVFDVYSPVIDLSEGTELLLQQLSPQSTAMDIQYTRYIAGMIALANKLNKRSAALDKVQTSLQQVTRRLEHFELLDSSIIENFADTYSQVISPLGRKIKVVGEANILQQPIAQQRVRALLFAGIRAAVLWRQLGGRRRHFLLKRSLIAQQAQLFYQELSPQETNI